MATKPTMMFAAGVFLVTTVLFAAAIVISHALSIPEPTRRFLPSAARDLPSAPPSEHPDDVALANDVRADTTSPSGEPVATVTAVPAPPAAVSSSGDDAAAGPSTASVADSERTSTRAPISRPAAAPSRQARAPSERPSERLPQAFPTPTPTPRPPESEPPAPEEPTPTETPEPVPSESESPPASTPVPGAIAPSESESPQASESATPLFWER